MLWPTVSRPVCLGIKHPSGAYDQIFITVGQFRVCWCGAISMTRGRVCRLKLLLALASTVIFGSQFLGARDHILLSQVWDFPFCRLLRLAGLRWRYSSRPPREILPTSFSLHTIWYDTDSLEDTASNSSSTSMLRVCSLPRERVYQVVP
jgi:hypothetical protein